MSRTLIDLSKITYTVSDSKPTYGQINTGCMQRIATATEAMAKDRAKMEHDLRHYKGLSERRYDTIVDLENSRRSLRGVITRLKNEIASLKSTSHVQ